MDGNLEWLSRNMSASVVTITGSTFLSGNLTVSSGITGSLFGTSSWAVSASWAPINSYIATASISASVNTDISASFRITSGSNTLLNLTRDGQVWIGNGTFTNAGYFLDVQGTGRFTSAGNSINIYKLNTRNSLGVYGGSAPVGVELPSVLGSPNATGYLIADASYYVPIGMLAWNGVGVGIKNNINASDITGSLSSIFTVSSTTQGILIPRMTDTQRIAISNPAQGLQVYDTGSSTEGIWYYSSGSTKTWTRVLNDTGSQSITGSLTVLGTITAQTIVAQTITASTEWITGSSKFGSLVTDTHQFTGSLLAPSITGSLQGTSSWAVSASWAPTPSINLTSSLIAIASITASVSTDLSSSFRVTSASNTLMTLTKDGQMWLGNGTFVNQGYQLDVQGGGRFTTGVRIEDSAGAITIPNNTAYISMNSNQRFIGHAPSLIGGNTNGLGIRASAIVFGVGSFGYHYFKSDYALFSTQTAAVDLDVNAPSGSAILEVRGTTKGFLPTRTDLTSNIVIPVQGLVTYVTSSSTEGIWYYSSGSIKAWTRVLNDTGSQSITGSLTATQGFTGSLFGTSSWAVSASWAPGGGGGTTLNGSGYVSMSGTTVAYVSSIPNSSLANSSITIQGSTTALGGSVNVINGTGFVKSTGTSITYDNSTYYSASNPNGYTSNAGTITSVTVTAGSGLSGGGTLTGAGGSVTLTNASPDQTVVLTNGTGISTTGTYPNFTITNTAPDQTVTLTNGTGISVTGTYPSFTITNTSPGGSLSGGKTNYNTIWNSTTTVSTGSLYQYSATQIVATGSSLAVGDITPSSIPGRIDASNDIVAFSTSDARFKDNVKPINNALQKVSSISGVEFDWIEDIDHHGNSGHDVGVIAQELERVLPEVVTTRDSGYKAVKYDKIVPLLIQAIKEQQSEINELKSRIDGLTK